MNLKRALSYIILGTVSLLLVSAGWAAAREVISFLPRKDGKRFIHFIDTDGKLLPELMVDLGRIATFSWAPDGRWITYNSNKDGAPDIYVRNVKTDIEHRLTFHGSRDIWPSWSPNGKWIAFISERGGEMDIYRMDADGGNVKRLTNQGLCKRPAWSPDSKSIAFVSKSSLYVMTAEGRGVRRLAETSSIDCSWSPDGKQIAFVPRGDAVGGIAVFSIDVNGRNMRQLTRLYKGLTLISDPVWSPSGKWIAYILTEIPDKLLEGARVPAGEFFANSVICVANTATSGGGKPLKATRELVPGHLDWVPGGFLSVSPSAEKQTVLWGKLKKSDK